MKLYRRKVSSYAFKSDITKYYSIYRKNRKNHPALNNAADLYVRRGKDREVIIVRQFSDSSFFRSYLKIHSVHFNSVKAREFFTVRKLKLKLGVDWE